MPSWDVTDRQGAQVAKLARDKKIPLDVFQAALDDGSMAAFLETLREDHPAKGHLVINRSISVTQRTRLSLPQSEKVMRDARSHELACFDASRVAFEHFLEEGESEIGGEEKLARFQKSKRIGYDPQIGFTLVDQPGQRVLKWLHKTQGLEGFTCPGLLLEDETGRQFLVYVYRRFDGVWLWHCGWPGGSWARRSPFLVSAPP